MHPFIETIHFSDYSKSKRFDLHASMVGLDSVAEDSKKPWNIGDWVVPDSKFRNFALAA
jgi:hypothetical protein